MACLEAHEVVQNLARLSTVRSVVVARWRRSRRVSRRRAGEEGHKTDGTGMGHRVVPRAFELTTATAGESRKSEEE